MIVCLSTTPAAMTDAVLSATTDEGQGCGVGDLALRSASCTESDKENSRSAIVTGPGTGVASVEVSSIVGIDQGKASLTPFCLPIYALWIVIIPF